MKKYTPKEIEPKWQKVWDETRIYEVTEDPDKKKIYATPMLPYPSGAGLHVGHVRNYSIADAVARFYRQRGYNVMSNIGWDAFGLPAENFAIKTGTPPAESTAQNIVNFKNQAKRLGISYAWDRELNTSDPEYYKWTQWLFTEFYKNKLAYQAENLQWWCTKCKTVLANEQVINGKCWRHDDPSDPEVEKRRTKQWFFKITDYADELLDNLDSLDWPESITSQQRNWIGKSVGAEVVFAINDSKEKITVFTTRIDTIFGATFLVLAPENQLLDSIVSDEQKDAVSSYVTSSTRKSDIERMDEGKEKTGVFTGAYATNPANGAKVPIWVGDFVLGGYGTGAIMAVPGHDQRDYDFALKFELPVVQVVEPVMGEPHGSEVVRESIIAILKHHTDDTYLVLDWGPRVENRYGGNLFIGGGIDGLDSAQETVEREIVEETGYTDFEKIAETEVAVHNYFFSNVKNKNMLDRATGFLYQLTSDKQVEQNLDEGENKFKLRWVAAKDVAKEINVGAHAWVHDQLVASTVYSGEGVMVNSGKYDGMSSSDAREKIVADLAKKSVAQEKVNYRMRDWLISRQRYWGAPIPIIHCEDCGAVPVPEKDLPVVLPEVKDFAPTGEATSVLATVDDWVNVECPTCDKPAKRETDTLDGYVCSSWYMYRYTDVNNNQQPWDPDKANYWFPVDFYFGGDHAVAHLLYFRFWGHFFADQGLIDKDKAEPVKKLVYNGYINAEDGSKMSKSKGNVVDPLDIIDSGYGADALRMYELFVGPYDQDVVWNPNGVPGTYRYLQRVWTLTQELLETTPTQAKPDPEKVVLLQSLTHKVIKKVTSDLEKERFNTAIAALMGLVNDYNKLKEELPLADAYVQWREALGQLMQLLAPFAPHMAEELFSEMGYDSSIHTSGWPAWDEELVKEDLLTIIVQVNGKLRANVEVMTGTEESEIVSLAQKEENVAKFTSEGKIVKTIYVPNKLVNFVVK